MKKTLALLLTICIVCGTLFPVCAQSSAAEPEQTTAAADTLKDCPYPIVLVTGIGQWWTHLVDENGTYKRTTRPHSDLFCRLFGIDDFIEYNFFFPDWEALLEPQACAATLRFAGQFLLSFVLNRNYLRRSDAETVLRALFRYHVIDKNGKVPADVENPVRPYPVRDYNERELYNFYRSIPCRFIVDEIGAENVFCFYHNAFSYIYDDAESLHDYIQNVVLKQCSGAEKVVLIPMSMGAAVVNAYLDLYPETDEVKRVVSIVGAWDGSDVVADLIEGKYAADAPEMLYHSLLPTLFDDDDPTGYLLTILERCVPKQTLRDIIDTILSALVQTLVLRTPSLMALVPSDRYLAIEQNFMQGAEFAQVRAQTHAYYEAQRDLQERLAALEARGVEFYFLSGYGLQFGGADASDFGYMRFMQSADTTNSDEIISISSTAPGADFAPAGQSLGRSGKYVSPDGSVDLSTSFAPERTWCFYRQRHELEFNNTALRLAFAIALGEVTDVRSSADRYPQFNQYRDVKTIVNERGRVPYPARLEQYILKNQDDPLRAADVARAKQMLERVNAMLDDTHNDPERDNALVEACRALLIELGEETPSAPMKQSTRRMMTLLETISEKLYKKYGAAGFADSRRKRLRNR